MKCIFYSENKWKDNDFIDLSLLCDAIDKYVKEFICANQLEKISIQYRNDIQNLSSKDCSEEYIAIAMACYYTANIALYDESLLYNTDEEDMDEDFDIYTWDTAYLISLLYLEEEQKTYWTWYVLTAKQLLGDD